jgi:short-subunit dehydrogenase
MNMQPLREPAHQLADQRDWLALAARNNERLEAAKAGCQKRGGKAIAVPADEGGFK